MRGEIMDNRRDILKSEITEFQQRLGIKVITTRNLKSIEDCRKAFVKIAEYYASISQGKLVNPGLDTEVDILRKKVKVLQEEKAELEEVVEFLKNPGRFIKIGARIPKGVLLVGPPGTGKT